jgi:hypothetical protein
VRVVLDEGVPRQLVHALRSRGIDASRFARGWTSLTNGALIAAAEADGYAVLVTNDKNMASQQGLKGRTIAIVALPHNRRRPILERADDVADTIRRAVPGAHIVVEWNGTRTMRRMVDGAGVTEMLPPVAPFVV